MLKEVIIEDSDVDSENEWEETSSSKSESLEELSDDEFADNKSDKEQEKDELVEYLYEAAPSPDESAEASEDLISEEDDGVRCYENPCNLTTQFYESLCSRDKRNYIGNFTLPWPYCRVHEREILDKILMMLLGIDTDIFIYRENGFTLGKKIELSHLTPSCLSNYLSFFLDLGTLFYTINEKSEELKNDECITHQYFGQGCKEISQHFRSHILSLQEDLAVQSGNVSSSSLSKFPQNILTLISLKNSLTPLSDQARLITSTIAKLSQIPEAKTCTILDYLYSVIQKNYALTDHSCFSIIVRLFLTTIKPFIEDLAVWLSQGTVDGLDKGFMIEKTRENQKFSDSWQGTYILRELGSSSQVPVFFKCVSSEVLTTGKNMMLIRRIEETVLDRVLPPASKLLLNLENSLYSNLLKESAHFLNQIGAETRFSISSVSWNCNKTHKIPLTNLSYQDKFQLSSSYSVPDVLVPYKYDIPPYKATAIHNTQLVSVVHDWISFQNVLNLTISNTIIQLHNDTCQYLLTLLHDKFSLHRFFKSIREVMLMENGESMRPFMKFINKKADTEDIIDNSYELSNVFAESVKIISHPEIRLNFTCELKNDVVMLSTIESLESIKINFSPPTPLEIFFDDATIAEYQKLYTRILQIKRALHCAKSLKWRSRAMVNSGMVHKKYLIFQKKLIHFTNCFEEYVLQNVLHSCANIFIAEEAKAKTIDELRDVHSRYLKQAIDRCLLSPKANSLNTAVTAVFSCCIKFYQLMKRVPQDHQDIETLELKSNFEDIQQNFETANRILLQVLSNHLRSRRHLQCNFYIDMHSYFSMNFNRFYLND